MLSKETDLVWGVAHTHIGAEGGELWWVVEAYLGGHDVLPVHLPGETLVHRQAFPGAVLTWQ